MVRLPLYNRIFLHEVMMFDLLSVLLHSRDTWRKPVAAFRGSAQRSSDPDAAAGGRALR